MSSTCSVCSCTDGYRVILTLELWIDFNFSLVLQSTGGVAEYQDAKLGLYRLAGTYNNKP